MPVCLRSVSSKVGEVVEASVQEDGDIKEGSDNGEDSVIFKVKTVSVVSGQRFTEDFLTFKLDLYDEVGMLRDAIWIRLHEGGICEEEARKYTAKVKMNVVSEQTGKKIGVLEPSMDEDTVESILNLFGTRKFYIQMPMSKKMVGGGAGSKRGRTTSVFEVDEKDEDDTDDYTIKETDTQTVKDLLQVRMFNIHDKFKNQNYEEFKKTHDGIIVQKKYPDRLIKEIAKMIPERERLEAQGVWGKLVPMGGGGF